MLPGGRRLQVLIIDMKDTYKNIVLWGGLTAIWYYVLRGARALSIKMVTLGFSGVDILAETISLRPVFRIANPLWVSVFVQKITGDLYIMDAKVAEINASINRPIAANAVTQISVPVEATMSGLSEAVVQNIRTGDVRTLLITFDGTVSIGKNNPVTLPVRIGLSWEDLQ